MISGLELNIKNGSVMTAVGVPLNECLILFAIIKPDDAGRVKIEFKLPHIYGNTIILYNGHGLNWSPTTNSYNYTLDNAGTAIRSIFAVQPQIKG